MASHSRFMSYNAVFGNEIYIPADSSRKVALEEGHTKKALPWGKAFW